MKLYTIYLKGDDNIEFKSYGIEAINSDCNKTALNEGKVYSDNIMYIGVYGSIDSNFQDAPYIKVYNNEKYEVADKVARIDLIDLKYIYHRDSKKIWYLNNKELKHLNKIMRSIDPKIGMYYWDLVLMEIARRSRDHDYEYYKKLFPNIPDFTKVRK